MPMDGAVASRKSLSFALGRFVLSCDEAALRRWLGLFVTLGIVARLIRYLLRFPLWGDECMVASSLLDRGYAELAQPLDFFQLNPLFFLWTERAAIGLLGFNEYSLRLFPLLCGLASVLLFRWLAGRLLQGLPLLLSVAIFCVSYYPIRHAAELKPYSSDLCFALLGLSLAVAWQEGKSNCAGWGLVILSPLAVGFSYPAVFVLGGTWLWLLWCGWTDRKQWTIAQSRARFALLALMAMTLAGGFLTHYFWVAQGQSRAAAAGQVFEMWGGGFPPLTQPSKLPVWVADVHTGRMLAYPVGGPRGGSLLTTLAVFTGAWVLWRRGDRRLALLLFPVLLVLVAAALRKYPYGESARTTLFLAPTICLLAGAGLGQWLDRASAVWQARCTWGLAAALAAVGLVACARDLVQPYKTAADQHYRQFTHWLWTESTTQGQAVCLVEDLGLPLYEPSVWKKMSPEYRCYRRIDLAMRRQGNGPPAWERVSAAEPLTCVLYRRNGYEPNRTILNAWLRQMAAQYEIRSVGLLTANRGAGEVYEHQHEIFEFRPRSQRFDDSSDAATPAETPHAARRRTGLPGR